MYIVYLHGVGDGDPDRKWLAALNRGLAQMGAPTVPASDVITPRYASLLRATDVSEKNPPITYKPKNERESRRAFYRRQARVEQLLVHAGIAHSFGLRRVPDVIAYRGTTTAINRKPFQQVKNYMVNGGLRGAVLKTILDDLPSSGKILLVAHSLGSVIAIDLLDHLPPALHVERFVTIGSPAGSPALHEGSERILKKFPYERVNDWSNLFDALDIVTAGRGLASLFPGAQDFVIDTGHSFKAVNYHGSQDYMAHTAVATLIADSLAPPRAPRSGEGTVARRLEDADASALVALSYGVRIASKIKDTDVANRYDDALKVLQDDYVDQLRARGEDGIGLPHALQTLVDGRLPPMPRHWDLDEAVTRVVLLAFTNVVDPFEIEVGAVRLDVLPDVFVDLGHTSAAGRRVRDAVQEVEESLRRESLFGTKSRIAAAAAGMALLAAAPIGLALAAPAAAAGAAAIVGGLAAFGPGGMVGGLAMLGGLASTGAMITTAAATMRSGHQPVVDDPTSIAVQVATAHALKKVGGPPDPELWQRLTIAENRVAAEINRLETYSDKKAPTLERLRANRDIIDKLMSFMLANDLAPTAVAAAALAE